VTFTHVKRSLAALAAQPHLLLHLTPLAWKHIALTGDYIWGSDEPFADGQLRPLRARPSFLAA
jgi:hypothetical protein